MTRSHPLTPKWIKVYTDQELFLRGDYSHAVPIETALGWFLCVQVTSYSTHFRLEMLLGKRKKNILEHFFGSVLSKFKKYHPLAT